MVTLLTSLITFASLVALQEQKKSHATLIAKVMEAHDVDVTYELDKFIKDFSIVLLVLTFFHLATHYMLRKLDKVEAQLNRIVDISAFRAKAN